MDETTNMPPEQPSAPPPGAAPSPAGGTADRPGPASDTSKLLAAIGYIIGIVAVVVLFIDPYKDEKFVKFHAIQAIALMIASIVLAAIPVIGWIAYIGLLVLQIMGLIKAFQGQYWEIPVVYGFVKGFIGEGE